MSTETICILETKKLVPLSKNMLNNNTMNAFLKEENEVIKEIYISVRQESYLPNTFNFTSKSYKNIRIQVVLEKLRQLFPECKVTSITSGFSFYIDWSNN